MTLYYTLVFGILCVEVACFLLLMTPVPDAWKKKVFIFLSNSPAVAHLRYILKIVFSFILLLFIDSVNRLNQMQNALNQALDLETSATAATMHNPQADANFAAKKFYAQRNLYLTGSTLFLTLILNHTTHLTIDIIRLQDERNRRLASTDTTMPVNDGPAPIVGLEKKNDKKRE
ncbi:B-cell receptor-associated protein 31-like-domain-containing protein [Dichotomocladium elegans]|nr:B-cell receptor-associated protein 31-like-domain-containing protein [Dichotomocladium elegans]